MNKITILTMKEDLHELSKRNFCSLMIICPGYSVLKTYLRARDKNSVLVIRLIPTVLVIEVVFVFTNIDKNAS